jgi:ABC-type branched-subunit amino acid transport system permease subunit
VSRGRALRIAGSVLLVLVIAFPIVWVLFIASGTNFGPAIDDPKNFLITLINGVTAAALYFIVASGFTLIFGLMRVVNMAHGAFFLLGGYIALELQRDFVPGAESALGISSACSSEKSAATVARSLSSPSPVRALTFKTGASLTAETLTSSHGYRDTQTRAATSVKPSDASVSAIRCES